ncbi:MAG: extracellular solute-binding protein, partial [Treponema sp.]|nr:extracellular solute-binding protein [Treponema sp.]
GNPAINTLADFDRVLGMVKQRYPNLIPYVTGAPTSWGNKALRVWSGVSTDSFAEENGVIKYYINSGNYRNYLQYVNQLYRKGYIMADNYSFTDTDVKALFTNGQAFSLSHCTSGEIYTFGEMAKAADPKAYSREIAILNSDTKYYITDAGWAAVVIPRKSRYPEEAVKFMQFMWTEEGRRLSQWGREGIEYTLGNNGLPAFSQEWLDATKDSNVLNSKYNNLYWMTTNSAWLTQSIAATIPEPFLATYRSVLPHLYICPWLGAATPKAEGAEKNILTKLNDMITNAEVKCFLAENDTEFTRYYNELMSNAKTIGVDQLESYMNQQIGQYRTMYQ